MTFIKGHSKLYRFKNCKLGNKTEDARTISTKITVSSIIKSITQTMTHVHKCSHINWVEREEDSKVLGLAIRIIRGCN